MKVISLSNRGVSFIRPEKAVYPGKGEYWRFTHGSKEHRGKLVVLPLAQRHFPGKGDVPPAKQEYQLVHFSDVDTSEEAYILTRDNSHDGTFLVLWQLASGDCNAVAYGITGHVNLIAEGLKSIRIDKHWTCIPCPVVNVTATCCLVWHQISRDGTVSQWVAKFDGEQWYVHALNKPPIAIEAAFKY